MSDKQRDGGANLISMGIAATKARKYKEAFALFEQAFASADETEGSGQKASYVEALSYYGLATAMTQGKFKKSAELCRKAIDLQFYNGEHFANLVRVYLESGSRKRAVEALQEGFRSLPGDGTLLALQREIGMRSRPVVPFLSRENPINVSLGKARHDRRESKEKVRRGPGRK
ncbi:MAG: hypothetical protein ABI718_03855 [Acidobacteriota bacterium]